MAPNHTQALVLGMCECHLIWQKSFCRCDQVKDIETGKLFWFLGRLSVNTRVLIRGRQEGQMRAREREEGHVTTEAGRDSEMLRHGL